MMQAFKNNRLVELLLYFTTSLLVFHSVAFSPAQAAEDPSEKIVQERQSKTLPQAKMRKAVGIEKAPRREDDRSWFSRNKWWVALSVILTGSIAAVAASGNSSDTNNNGSYHLEWGEQQ
jgi:hypothetical protein